MTEHWLKRATPEQRAEWLRKIHEGRKKWRASASPEQLAEITRKNTEGRRKRFASYSPEERELHNAKLKAGRNKYYASLKGGKKGRPHKHNYHKGWDPAKKSAASKANWERWRVEQPEIPRNLIESSRRATEKKTAKSRQLRNQFEQTKKKTTNALKVELKNEQKRLYELAKSVMADTGVEPEKNQTIDYYKEIINFFKPGTV